MPLNKLILALESLREVLSPDSGRELSLDESRAAFELVAVMQRVLRGQAPLKAFGEVDIWRCFPPIAEGLEKARMELATITPEAGYATLRDVLSERTGGPF